MRRIPVFEPEVVAARSRRWRGDSEKVATTALDEFEWHGVQLSSRYGKAYEIEEMGRMVDAVPVELRHRVLSVFCDSKAEAVFSIVLEPTCHQDAWLIGELMVATLAGHNGVSIDAGPYSYEIDPNWATVHRYKDGVRRPYACGARYADGCASLAGLRHFRVPDPVV